MARNRRTNLESDLQPGFAGRGKGRTGVLLCPGRWRGGIAPKNTLQHAARFPHCRLPRPVSPSSNHSAAESRGRPIFGNSAMARAGCQDPLEPYCHARQGCGRGSDTERPTLSLSRQVQGASAFLGTAKLLTFVLHSLAPLRIMPLSADRPYSGTTHGAGCVRSSRIYDGMWRACPKARASSKS